MGKAAFLLLIVCTFSRAELLQAAWACRIPCVDSGAPSDVLQMVHISYCGTHVLSDEMLKQITPLCVKKTGRKSAVAARREGNMGLYADCISSGNRCASEGLVRTGYQCKVMCSETPELPRKYSVCALDTDEAWSVATQICTGAAKPTHMPPALVCEGNGQTVCEE